MLAERSQWDVNRQAPWRHQAELGLTWADQKKPWAGEMESVMRDCVTHMATDCIQLTLDRAWSWILSIVR